MQTRRIKIGEISCLAERRLLSLKISTRQAGDVTILDLRGALTIESGASRLRSRAKKLDTVQNVVLNLADVTKIDSTGIGFIVEMSVSFRRRGGELRLLRPRGRVLEILKLLRLLDTIPHFDNEGQALDSFPHPYAVRPWWVQT